MVVEIDIKGIKDFLFLNSKKKRKWQVKNSPFPDLLIMEAARTTYITNESD